MPRKGGKRPLAPGEKSLWRKVAETVSPLSGVAMPELVAAPTEEPAKPAPIRPRRHAAAMPLSTAKKDAPRDPDTPRLDAGDPKMARRVARGRIEIDGTLDLHGYSQEEARTRLYHFIDFAALRGNRVILIITGKGSRGDEDHRPFGEAPRGILRQRFLEWVEEAPLRQRITSVRQSHQRHGGGGAFYVFLRGRDTHKL